MEKERTALWIKLLAHHKVRANNKSNGNGKRRKEVEGVARAGSFVAMACRKCSCSACTSARVAESRLTFGPSVKSRNPRGYSLLRPMEETRPLPLPRVSKEGCARAAGGGEEGKTRFHAARYRT